MIAAGLVLIVIAAIFLVFGVAVASLKVLLWVGVILLAVGAVVALVGRNRRTPLE